MIRSLALILTFIALTVCAYAQSQTEQLRQMAAQLESNRDDNALRERIIKFAAAMKPAPAIPEDANKASVKGGVFKENAKDPSDYDLAVAAFREAVRIAPWWGDAYFNLGVTLGLVGKFDEAIASLKLSMASVPADSKEARDAQNRIYALEAKAELASKQAAAANAENERAARAAKAKADADAAEKERQRPTVEGRWDLKVIDFKITKRGETYNLIPGLLLNWKPDQWVAVGVKIDSQRVRFGYKNLFIKCPECDITYFDVTLSESGNELEGTSTLNGQTQTITAKRMP